MRNYFVLCLLIFIGSISFSQNKHIQLTNGLIVAQLDRPEEKFTLEINLAELFANEGVQVIPSLNILKQGEIASVLASDSIIVCVLLSPFGILNLSWIASGLRPVSNVARHGV